MSEGKTCCGSGKKLFGCHRSIVCHTSYLWEDGSFELPLFLFIFDGIGKSQTTYATIRQEFFLEKYCVACSGFPSCSNAGHTVLSPGGSFGTWSEPFWVCVGQAASLEHPSGWATHRDLWWEWSVQTNQGFAQFYCSPSVAPVELVAPSGLECRVWNAHFCSEVLSNASAFSFYHAPDCDLVYSQAEKKVIIGLSHPYAMGTGCVLC